MSDHDHAQAAIGRLQHSYADVVSRQAFAELDRLFRPDARVVMELPHSHDLDVF